MVGVPGKSKGCSTCRRRKKGCDQKRPICGQCASSGYVCGGYHRDRTFILHPDSKAVEKAHFLPYVPYAPTDLPPSLFKSAVDTQCRSLFWDLYMPRGDCMCKDQFIISRGHPMAWVELIPHSQQDTSLSDAFSALSISRVGQGSKDVRLARESTKFYTKALKELQTALYDPERMHSDHVLMACMLLGIYEVLEGPTFNSRTWVMHARGAAKLVQLRGPERHREWDAHHPFLASRIPTIYAAMMQRKGTYLATEEWLTIPWVLPHRTYLDTLVDQTTQIPGMLEKFDVLAASTDPRPELLQMLDECKSLQLKMNVWRDGTKPGALPELVKHESLDDEYPFEGDIWFANHLFVHARLIYWTASLVLAELAEDILFALGGRNAKPRFLQDASDPTALFNVRREALQIAQTVPYCIQPEMGALGASMIHYPANMAYAYFKKVGDHAATEWLWNAFENIKSRGIHVDLLSRDVESVSGESAFRFGKRESSAETGSPETSTSSALTVVSLSAAFVYEDPSKDYYVVPSDAG